MDTACATRRNVGDMPLHTYVSVNILYLFLSLFCACSFCLAGVWIVVVACPPPHHHCNFVWLHSIDRITKRHTKSEFIQDGYLRSSIQTTTGETGGEREELDRRSWPPPAAGGAVRWSVESSRVPPYSPAMMQIRIRANQIRRTLVKHVHVYVMLCVCVGR